MRLEFGNPEHIKLRDQIIIEEVWKKLKNKVRCPLCRAKAYGYFEYDINKKWIGINFECKPTCGNSAEYACEHGDYEPDVYFTFGGKRLEFI